MESVVYSESDGPTHQQMDEQYYLRNANAVQTNKLTPWKLR